MWSWVTSLEVSHQTVVEVATNGGRQRWRTENEGFNTQKNSGLNLEHAYSHTCWAANHRRLQIAHLLLQLLEKGSLLRHLAREQGKRTAVELFGSLKNMAQRLLEKPAVPALAGRGLRPNSSRLDPGPARHQLVVSGVRVCSRLGRVALGLVAIALEFALRACPPLAFSGPRLDRWPSFARMHPARGSYFSELSSGDLFSASAPGFVMIFDILSFQRGRASSICCC